MSHYEIATEPMREDAMKAAEMEREEGRVYAEHAALRASFERLDHQVGRLSERLVKVLQPTDATTVNPGVLTGVEQKPISPLAARLQDDAHLVNRVADRVSELIDRLEV